MHIGNRYPAAQKTPAVAANQKTSSRYGKSTPGWADSCVARIRTRDLRVTRSTDNRYLGHMTCAELPSDHFRRVILAWLGSRFGADTCADK